MLARCSLAVCALTVCLLGSQAIAQDDKSTSGKLTLPKDLDYQGATSGSLGNEGPMVQSGVTGMEGAPNYMDAGAPLSYGAAGSSYSSSLGGHLRARYSTQSYGQVAGNLDLGSMFMHIEGDRALFFDGQVTMNDESQVGFNLGVGARAITETELGGEAIVGLSLWADGTSTINDNFFPQVGISYELLTETWDLRANASFVLEDQTAFGDPQLTGGLSFFGNNLVESSTTGRDNAMHLTELELARRIGNKELWGFAGAYGLYGEGDVETAGYKLGFRGYATPDLALQLAVTDDDLFQTNTVFSITWFIGRTRTDTPVHCDLRDRLREPVQRNDYVAVYQDSIAGGGALTFDTDGDGTSEDIRFVHVDSTASAGGDGSFENPLNSLNDINANSQTNDVVLVHSGSTFTEQGAVLQDGQRLLGEGADMTFTVNTDKFGVLTIPETATGAQAGTAPIINNTAATAVTLADNNEVANLTINGGASAIVAGGTGAGDPNLHDLAITGTTGDGIVLTPFERVDGANTTIAFNAMLNNITFSGIGGNDIDIDATTASDPTLANVTLNEAISITNITSTGGADVSLNLRNTHAGGTANIDTYTYDGGTTGLGAMAFTTNAGTVNVTNSTATGGAAGGTGFLVDQNTGIATIGASNTVTDIVGRAAFIDRAGAQVDFAATVNNTTAAGGTVRVAGNTAAVNINGDITTQDATSIEVEDAAAAVTVAGNVTRNGTAGTAVSVVDNTAGDGGSVLFSDPNNAITSNGGSMAAVVTGGDDDVTFLSSITDTGGLRVSNRTGGTVDFGGDVTTNTAATDAVVLTNNDGATISFNELDITTTTGRGLFADSGDISVTGANSTITSTGITTGALVLDGTVGTPVTSTGGVTFASVDTAAGSTNAVVLDNVEGNVTINGGTLNTAANAAVQINNATGVTLSGVELASGGADALTATYSSDNANTLSVSGVDMNGDNLSVASTTTAAAASTTATLSNITDAGDLDFDANGLGDLTAVVNTLTGTGDVTLDVTNSGSGSLNMNGVNTGGTITANSTAGVDGNLSVTVANSGGTTQFGAIAFNDQGDGNGTLTLNNVESNSTMDFDSAGGGSATLTINGGTYGGAVTADTSNTGTFIATMNGGGTYSSTVDINAGNGGLADITVNGNNNITGAFTLNTTNTGDANINLDNNFGDVVAVTAANTENLNFQMTNANITAGAVPIGFDLDITNAVDDASVILTSNTYDSGVRVTADNDANLNVRVNNDSVTTGTDDVAFTLLVDDDVSDADILIQNADYTTNNATAFLFTNNSASPNVDFHLDNNAFSNASAASITADLNTSTGTLNATVNNGNTFANTGAAVEFEFTSTGTAIVNSLVENNTANNAGFNLVETAGTFGLFDRDNAATNNTGTFNFNPAIGNFDDLGVAPQLPTF